MASEPILDLDAIRARLAAATPGPWRLGEYGSEIVAVCAGNRRISSSRPACTVCPPNFIGRCPHLPRPRVADAELIAHAPADIAALLAEVERLRADADADEAAALLPTMPPNEEAAIDRALNALRSVAASPIPGAEYARGVADERARVVAWLRAAVAVATERAGTWGEDGPDDATLAAGQIADALERGDHGAGR